MTPNRWTQPRHTPPGFASNFARGLHGTKVVRAAAVRWVPEVGEPGPGVPITPRRGRILVRATVQLEVSARVDVTLRVLLDGRPVGEAVSKTFDPGMRPVPLLLNILLPVSKTSMIGIRVSSTAKDIVNVLPGSTLVLQELGPPGDSEFVLG